MRLPLFYLITCSLAAQAEDSSVLTPMTVTATRTDQDTSLVSSTLINRDDIERLQARSVEEILRGIAGVNVVSSGGFGKQTSVFLRGTDSDHVLVMVDGIRMGSVTSGTSAFEFLPINEIDSIEVIRGPRSSLYGSEAIGGIIHIRTRNGSSAARTVKPYISGGMGSHDHYQASAGVSGVWEDSWYNLNVSHEKTNGFDAYQDSETDADGYRNQGGSVRLGHRFGDRLTLEGHALYSDGDTHYDGSWQNETDFVQQVIGGNARLKATDFWEIKVQGGETQDRAINRHDGVDSSSFNTRRRTVLTQNDFQLAENHLLSVGYEFLNDSVESSTAYDEDSRDNHAYFGQYQGHYQGHSLILGLRQDHNQQFGRYATWNAAWGYRFAKDWEVSASYGTAYKTPTFNDLYYPNYSNPNLNPERSRSYEIGLSGPHPWGHWAANAYLTYISDLIALDGSYLPNNIDQARIVGFELTGDAHLYGFDIRTNLTLVNPENHGGGKNDGEVLLRRAEKIFRLDIDRRVGDLTLGTTLNAEGRRFDEVYNAATWQTDRVRLSGFVTWDLRAEYELFDQIRLQAKVKNILNKEYQTASGYNQDELNVFFNITYTPEF